MEAFAVLEKLAGYIVFIHLYRQKQTYTEILRNFSQLK